MSELEDLPSWAGRLTREVTPPATADESDTARSEAAAAAAPASGEADASQAAPTEPTPPTPPAEPAPPAEPVGKRPGLAARAAAQVPEPPAAPELPRADEAPSPESATQELTTPVIGASPVIERVAPAATAPAATVQQASAAQTAPAAASPSVEPVTGLPSGVPTTRRRSPLRALLLALVGLAILAGAGYGGYLLANRSSSDETATTGGDEAVVPDSPSTSEAATETATGAVDGDADDTATDATDGTDAAAGDDAAAGEEAAAGADEGSGQQTVKVEVDGADATGTPTGATEGDAPMNDGDRRAYFRGGKVYLTGAVPSPEIAELIVQKAAQVVGPDNVVNEYTIDPNTTIRPGDSAPLYVEDVILFDFNSVEIATPFIPILDLGVLLLRQNPQASITVVTRTDAVGAASVNLDVSEKRADAVINYWLSRGVDRDQIKTDPRGEEGASEDDDAETAARQRRAEFIITGLLD